MKKRTLTRIIAFCLAGIVCIGFLIAESCGDKQEGDVSKKSCEKLSKSSENVWSFLPDVIATVGDSDITKADFLLQLANDSGITPSSQLVVDEFEKMYQTMPEAQQQAFEDSLKKQNITKALNNG